MSTRTIPGSGRSLTALTLVLLLWGTSACRSRPTAVRLATTTSVENSGLIATILPPFERETGVTVEVLGVGSGQALNLLERGDATVAITHDPTAEASALAAGLIDGYRKIMFNDFVIVGPPSDPAGVASASGAADALRRIVERGAVFVSRGDASGTHTREQELWALTKLRPDQLLETGQGMGATLRVASERSAYTLTDRATFEQFKSGLRLSLLGEGGSELLNTYAVFLGSAATGRARDRGEALAEWLADGEGRELVASFLVNGQRVFEVWPTGAARDRPTDLPPAAAANAR